MEVLEHSVNRFNGAVIERNSLPEDPDLFGRRLAHSLKVWKSDGILIIWLEVPIGAGGLDTGERTRGIRISSHRRELSHDGHSPGV